VDLVPCATNPAAFAPPRWVVIAAAPSSMDVERPRSSSPDSSPSAPTTTGGSTPASTSRSVPVLSPGAVPASPSAATDYVKPPIRNVYTRRLHGVVRQPAPRVPVPRPLPSHPMVTRSKTGSLRQVHPMNLSATSTSPVPSNYRSALADPNWRAVCISNSYSTCGYCSRGEG
jgi:hypothetical protein